MQTITKHANSLYCIIKKQQFNRLVDISVIYTKITKANI